MLDKNVELLKYLTDIRKEFDAYHNHKELMVWFGVVLFIGLLTMIINAKVPENTNVPSPALNLFKSFGIILFTVIVCATRTSNSCLEIMQLMYMPHVLG